MTIAKKMSLLVISGLLGIVEVIITNHLVHDGLPKTGIDDIDSPNTCGLTDRHWV